MYFLGREPGSTTRFKEETNNGHKETKYSNHLGR